ncbi:hypothetical protein [Mycobacterium rhizamassiliense]|uniref:hypothetical protein n=1 Tax=Mycobacterium rhizamassiliense TaxID=1841860 RepID=UPI00097D555E|nr:hypothetical protein [Mycobacterium rhizamassiliense]
MASEIPVALISGGFGLALGWLTPLAKWKVADEPGLKRQERVQRIANWRQNIRDLRLAETHTLALIRENAGPAAAWPEVNPREHEWYRDLKSDLSDNQVRSIEYWRRKPIATREGKIPTILEQEVRRIEREWHLR